MAMPRERRRIKCGADPASFVWKYRNIIVIVVDGENFLSIRICGDLSPHEKTLYELIYW
jgi:hypothetical protein